MAVLLRCVAVLLGTVLLGSGGPAWAVPGAGSVVHGHDPYAHGGMVLRLPGGGHVRLVHPHRPAAAAPPSTGPGASPEPGTGGGAGGGASPPPDGGSGGGTAEPVPSPSLSLADLPVPLLSPLYPTTGPAHPGGGAGSASPGASDPASAPPTAAESGRPSGGASAGASEGVHAGSAAPTAPAPATPSADGSGRPDPGAERIWLPVGAGPPPLGPQALAPRPAGADAVAQLPGPRAEDGRRSAQAASWERKRRLLPLGVGLALIGAGAALFGWRLRRL